MENTETTANTVEKKIITKNIQRELSCKLTDAQLLEKATKKADLEAELESIEEQFSDVKGDWNKRIADQEKRIHALGTEIRERASRMPVTCHERFDSERKVIEIVREDTNEVVDTRYPNLFEANQHGPKVEHVAGDEVAAPGDDASEDDALEAAQAEANAAAQNQQDQGIEENEDGDVVPTDEAAPKKKRGKKS